MTATRYDGMDTEAKSMYGTAGAARSTLQKPDWHKPFLLMCPTVARCVWVLAYEVNVYTAVGKLETPHATLPYSKTTPFATCHLYKPTLPIA
eukprot:6347073-Amphidinium_carterae.1